MARGQQKIQSQQKAAEKAAKLKKMVSSIVKFFDEIPTYLYFSARKL